MYIYLRVLWLVIKPYDQPEFGASPAGHLMLQPLRSPHPSHRNVLAATWRCDWTAVAGLVRVDPFQWLDTIRELPALENWVTTTSQAWVMTRANPKQCLKYSGHSTPTPNPQPPGTSAAKSSSISPSCWLHTGPARCVAPPTAVLPRGWCSCCGRRGVLSWEEISKSKDLKPPDVAPEDLTLFNRPLDRAAFA